MASISESIGATEVLVPYFCQARDGGHEYGSYSQYRAHLAIFQPIWRKGWHRPKLGIISYVISAFLPLFCQKVAKIDPSGRIRAIFSYKKAFETLVHILTVDMMMRKFLLICTHQAHIFTWRLWRIWPNLIHMRNPRPHQCAFWVQKQNFFCETTR